MKNKPLWITVILLTIVTIAFYQKEVNPVVENNKKINKYNTSILSINLETSAGSGVYEEATDSKWPESGYTFNTELSRCEQGSEITWDEETEKVLISSNKSDKCYVYFDKVIVYLNNYIKSLYTTQGANNLYNHDGTLENGIDDGSYRYAGSYETTNNWVCFGTDTEKCDDERLYRIIGVFNEKNVETEEIESRVKLIKAYEGTKESLGTAPHGDGYKNITYYKGKLNISPGYYWSGSSEQKENSEIWTNSTLNTEVLNGTYLSTLETKWINMLAKTAWKIGKIHIIFHQIKHLLYLI